MIMEENLHIRFRENTPNAEGSGPDWLFDIDALARIMNYEPIVSGTQSNGFVGTKAYDNAMQARKEIETYNEYVVVELTKKKIWEYNNPSSPYSQLQIIKSGVYIKLNINIIFGSTKKEVCNAFEKLMHEKFQMSSMGEITFFLGLQVQQKKDGIFISQDKYVVEILKKFGFIEVKAASTPMETQKPMLKDEDGEEVDVNMHRSMIDSLIYLTSSRHDIMFAVCACARYQVNPKVSHLYAVKRIFRYLKGQPKLSLWYPNDSLFDLVAYTDSDYAGASLDMKSTIGGCQFLGCRLISWQCKKQTVVANSTTEAKYVGASSCCGQVLWIQNQLLDYGVLDLEKIKTTQAKEIVNLKRRVKKLEQKKRSRTHGLKRLIKVSATTRVESSGDEQSLGEDASKQGRRINDIDEDEDITLVNVQDDAEMFDVNTLTGDEVFAEQEVAAKRLIIGDESGLKIEADHELTQRLQAEEQEELSVAEKAKLFQQLLEQRRKHFAAKSTEEKRNKPPTQAQQRKIMCTYLKNMEGKKHKDLKNKSFDSIQKMFDRAFKRVNTFVDFRTNLVEGSSKRAGEEKEVAIDVVPLATKPPTIVDWKIYKEGKKSYYQIVRADEKSQMYRVFSLMLKRFSREDLEDLYKLVKAKYKSTRPVEDLDLVLWSNLKTMFKPHVEDEIWKLQQKIQKFLSWKLFDSCGVHCLSL
ncbi:putative ribonuclease H-like domain-containing protein [Tanacetum coccineum]